MRMPIRKGQVVSGSAVTRDKAETRKAAPRLIVSGVSGVSGEYIKVPATTPVPASDPLPTFLFRLYPCQFPPETTETPETPRPAYVSASRLCLGSRATRDKQRPPASIAGHACRVKAPREG